MGWWRFRWVVVLIGGSFVELSTRAVGRMGGYYREDDDARPAVDSEYSASANVHEKQDVGVGESTCP